MSRRFIAEQEIFSFWGCPSCVIANAIEDKGKRRSDIIDLPIEQKREIYNFITGYNNKLFAFGNDEESGLIVPSIYPSSSLSIALRFPFSVSILHKLAGECGVSKNIEFSKYSEVKSLRISKRITDLCVAFSMLYNELNKCFGKESLLNKKAEEGISAFDIEECCYRLSYFTGCPIDIEVEREAEYCETDMALFSAWFLTFLMSARNRASDRCAKAIITSQSNAAHIEASFLCDESVVLTAEINEWQRIAADKNMLFDRVQRNDGKVILLFHPYRYDWSRLGIKQDVPFLE